MDAAGPSPDHTAALPVFDMSVLSLGGVTPPVFHPVALALMRSRPCCSGSGRPENLV